MRIAYEEWNPNARSIDLVRIANAICGEMKAQGYDLTLRQLYYQFVARGYVENTQRSYKNLGELVNKARLAGLLDWDYIEDRTRALRSVGHYDSPAELIQLNRYYFHVDKWAQQDHRVEVWVEKEALASVVGRSANRLDTAYFACKGYVSQSELHAAALRHIEYNEMRQQVHVIHLGDHDPSGIDMTRDIQDRLQLFGADTTVERIALNRDQIDQYNPPPNPAKLTDSRAGGYIAAHGTSSWELDALTPSVIDQLVTEAIEQYLDRDAYDEARREEKQGQEQLGLVSEHWDAVADFITTL